MPKVSPQTVLITLVAGYAGYRAFKGAQRRRALAAGASLPALPGGATRALPAASQTTQFTGPAQARPNPRVVDWRERGTPQGIDQAIRAALSHDSPHIHSSRELALQAGGRLWPGLSIHPAGLDAVQARVRQLVIWSDVPDTEENHEACVRLTAHGEHVLNEALQFYGGQSPVTVVQDSVASSIFPELSWPPSPNSPDWMHEVWARVGFMVDQRLREQGRLPGSSATGDAAIRDEEPQPAAPKEDESAEAPADAEAPAEGESARDDDAAGDGDASGDADAAADPTPEPEPEELERG